jgi:hypothetical protein
VTGFEKGDYVVAVRDGAGDNVSVSGRHSYRAGEELEVTVVYPDRLNVRSSRGGPVFRIALDRVRAVPRLVGEVPVGAIPPEHPGIAWLFEDAARMADRLGLCADFDRICDALNIPGRMRTFTVEVFSGDGIKVTAKVDARSQRLAEQRVREQLAPAAPLALEQIRDEDLA